MSIAEARKYIQDLHKRQENPYLWPDFLTGLPDKAAILNKLQEVYPKLGKSSVVYIRIANIHPYLIKYGPDKHADIIQWAAAILKTSCDRCRGCFVGTVSTHDFVVMCETRNIEKHMKEVQKAFNKQVQSYYVKEDLQKKTTLSFSRNGEIVRVGLIRMVAVVIDKPTAIEQSLLIREMSKACDVVESGDADMVRL
jgi:GGDEF domain-containing protein